MFAHDNASLAFLFHHCNTFLIVGHFCEEGFVSPYECASGSYMPYGVNVGTGTTVGKQNTSYFSQIVKITLMGHITVIYIYLYYV